MLPCREPCSSVPAAASVCFAPPTGSTLYSKKTQNKSCPEFSSGKEESHYDGFDFAPAQSFVKDIGEALLWEDVAEESQRKQRKYFKNVRKEALNFPLMEEIQEIANEWKQVDRIFSFKYHFAKQYPFRYKDIKILEEPLVVNAAL